MALAFARGGDWHGRARARVDSSGFFSGISARQSRDPTGARESRTLGRCKGLIWSLAIEPAEEWRGVRVFLARDKDIYRCARMLREVDTAESWARTQQLRTP